MMNLQQTAVELCQKPEYQLKTLWNIIYKIKCHVLSKLLGKFKVIINTNEVLHRVSSKLVNSSMMRAKTSCISFLSMYRFHDKRNKVICSDPDSDWAKKVMKIVDERQTTKPSPKPTTCYTRTTNVILTVNTTNKSPGTETETSTSTTITPAVTTIKTSVFGNFHSPEM